MRGHYERLNDEDAKFLNALDDLRDWLMQPFLRRTADVMANVPQTGVAPPMKESVNPNAYYTYKEAEALGFGKYMVLHSAKTACRLRACYSGTRVRFKGSDLVDWIEMKTGKGRGRSGR